jgi:hypothetical protein
MDVRRLLQFRLRTLLFAITAASISLGLWFKPFYLEAKGRDEDGFFTATYRVRRGILGGEVAHGEQVRRYSSGRVVWVQWGEEPNPFALLAHGHQYVLTDGTAVPQETWEALLLNRPPRPMGWGWWESP